MMKCGILIFSCGKAVNSSVAYHYLWREKSKLVRSSLCHNFSWVNSTSSSKRLLRQDLSFARHVIIVRTSLARVPSSFRRPPYYNPTQSRKRQQKCEFFIQFKLCGNTVFSDHLIAKLKCFLSRDGLQRG